MFNYLDRGYGMNEPKCKIDEHIFSVNKDSRLACDKCKILYHPEYLADVEDHKHAYRSKLWKQ